MLVNFVMKMIYWDICIILLEKYLQLGYFYGCSFIQERIIAKEGCSIHIW